MTKTPRITRKAAKAKQHYWLMAGYIISLHPDGSEHQRGLNSLLITEHDRITRADLAKTQQTMTMRFTTETEQVKGAKIVDAFIVGTNYLGLMTQEEFHAGFPATKPEAENKDQPEKAEPQKTETLQ